PTPPPPSLRARSQELQNRTTVHRVQQHYPPQRPQVHHLRRRQRCHPSRDPRRARHDAPARADAKAQTRSPPRRRNYHPP
ncbi:hypothetical protein LTR16_005195, partial [Cryomyces antarcticus]